MAITQPITQPITRPRRISRAALAPLLALSLWSAGLLTGCSDEPSSTSQGSPATSSSGQGGSGASSSGQGGSAATGGQGGSGASSSSQGGNGQGGNMPPVFDPSKVDVIGYHGNSGNAPSKIPLLTDIPCYYNILILTFANFGKDTDKLQFEMQGPYENDPGLATFKSDIKAWKAKSDPFGRQRKVLFSIGGQNGHWPDDLSAAQVESEIMSFVKEYDLDGLDVDLEGGSVTSAGTLLDVIKKLRQQGYLVTAAPEAAQAPLNAYAPLLAELDWVQPQFYNNPPNAVAAPYAPMFNGSSFVPPPTKWYEPTPADYDFAGEPYWLAVLETTSAHLGLTDSQKGMLIPTTNKAAGSQNDWDIDQLKAQITASKVRRVGTWAIAYDNEINYKFAKTMSAIMDPNVTCE